MIVERIEESSGAIIFDEDEDTKNLKYLLIKFKDLEKRVEELENLLKLKNKDKEDS